MKYLLIISSLKRGGGAERQVALMSKRLVKEGHSVKIITFYEENDCYDYAGEMICLKEKIGSDFLTRIKKLLVRAYKIRKIVDKEEGRIVVNSFMEDANFPTLWSMKKSLMITYDVNVRCFPSQQYRGFYGVLYKKLIRMLYKKADKVIANSTHLKHDLIGNYGLSPDKVVVVYNKIDWKEIEELKNKPVKGSLFDDSKVIISVGRLTPDKGQDYLIEAYKIVKEKVSDAKLVFLGDGELRNKFEEVEGVHFFGRVNNPFKFMAKSKVFAFTSLTEGFPNVLIEAMFCGCPIVSTDCYSGTRELISPKTDVDFKTDEKEHADFGVLIPCFDRSDDVEEEERKIGILADALIEMLTNENFRTGYAKMAQVRAEDFFDDKKVDEIEVEEYYDK